MIGQILEILGALAFFIYGMKLMSDGIQRAAGSELRNILRSMTKNRFIGVFTGFLITALLQSSSATTVMTVSFVNAGLLTLVESAGVMMGANIGTTITGWLISLLGFKVKLATYSIPLFAFGVPMIFANRGKIRYWGQFIVGFAILFLGLSYLKGAVPDIKSNPEILSFLEGFANWGFFSNIFFVFVGAIVTIVVQSSSAAMAITLTLCANGLLPFDVAAAMVLGENIGTTITAELASLVGNTNAKRSARIHSMFNIIGVTWMVIILPWVLPVISRIMQSVLGIGDPFDADPTVAAESIPLALAGFHTIFNLTNVLLLLGFVPWLVKMAIWSVKGAEDEDDIQLKHISTVALTPELATIELQKEAAYFGEVVSRMSKFLAALVNNTKEKKQMKMLKKIKKYEEITDRLEIQITEYITKLADREITAKTSKRLRGILNICNDLERIGDIYYQISKTIEQKIEEKVYFLPDQRNNINEMIELVDNAFAEMLSNLSTPSYDKVSKERAVELEKQINAFRDKLREDNNKRLGNPEYNVKSAMVYNNVFSSLERVGDHIINVSESVIGEI